MSYQSRNWPITKFKNNNNLLNQMDRAKASLEFTEATSARLWPLWHLLTMMISSLLAILMLGWESMWSWRMPREGQEGNIVDDLDLPYFLEDFEWLKASGLKFSSNIPLLVAKNASLSTHMIPLVPAFPLTTTSSISLNASHQGGFNNSKRFLASCTKRKWTSFPCLASWSKQGLPNQSHSRMQCSVGWR